MWVGREGEGLSQANANFILPLLIRRHTFTYIYPGSKNCNSLLHCCFVYKCTFDNNSRVISTLLNHRFNQQHREGFWRLANCWWLHFIQQIYHNMCGEHNLQSYNVKRAFQVIPHLLRRDIFSCRPVVFLIIQGLEVKSSYIYWIL